MSLPTQTTLENLVTLCKRRGIIFPSSDIYGGYAGFFDYGPLGVEIKNNVKQAWWRDFVHRREDIVGLDSSIIMHPRIWKASGHVDGFSDPMVDCKESKYRYRADQLFMAPVSLRHPETGEDLGVVAYACVLEDQLDTLPKRASAIKKALDKKSYKVDEALLAQTREYTEATEEERSLVWGPDATKGGTLTEPREFKLMFETHVGALRDESAVAYLRPETAQGIFANYKNVLDTSRVKVPFGIAQIGKAFRNEITPRNFVFRCREFEQMEIEYFIAPDADWKQLHREWIDYCINWYVSIGLPRDMIGEDVHPDEKLAHYAKACTDLTFLFPHGKQELEGIAVRGNFDLTQHQEHSKKNLEYFDEATKERYLPHVIEPSFGLDRAVLALLTAAYTVDEVPNDKGQPEERVLMRFHPRIAPYKVAIFPLVKNKPELVEKARGIYDQLLSRWNVFWDVAGAIGRRYRRQDEIGTPYCVTVDFDTIEKDNCVTVRDRDTTQQERVPVAELEAYLSAKLGF
ncbi:MAG: glycine--tRNA ligase [Opitutales bacterium]|nr:glycine--tRNA ligase [Opitutales bacterium]